MYTHTHMAIEEVARQEKEPSAKKSAGAFDGMAECTLPNSSSVPHSVYTKCKIYIVAKYISRSLSFSPNNQNK